MLKKIFSTIHKIERRLYSPPPGPQRKTPVPPGKVSYAQCGEDLIMDYIFNLRGVALPTYLDIGAHHPWFLSNTAYFYLKGCRGINIEPNPALIEAFRRERAGDINLNVGIGSTVDMLSFYEMSDATLSTFSRKEADELVGHGFSISKSYPVQVLPLRQVLNEHFKSHFPDLLTIDVEGLEVDILESIDFDQSFPKIICVETAEYSPQGSGAKRQSLINLIESKGYYLYADTNLNSIFVKNEFWFV